MTAGDEATAGEPTSEATPPRGRSFRGSWLVMGMICLGCVTTAGLFWFWNTRTADYLPLADALAEALPGSSPRVEGGRRRRPDPDVTLLQVMLKVPFDPGEDHATPPPQAAATLETVEETVAASPFAGRYDVLEVHLRRDGPGGVITSATYTRPMPKPAGSAERDDG
ncbi:hypothetical protein [Alienimonas sp. DA493]|uniref:hypothetical protein n=1 Tax=Alienimonas sp. DA493 TaxID=3373605 RepID=UPI003754973B